MNTNAGTVMMVLGLAGLGMFSPARGQDTVGPGVGNAIYTCVDSSGRKLTADRSDRADAHGAGTGPARGAAPA